MCQSHLEIAQVWRMLDRRTCLIWYIANLYMLTLVMRQLHIEMSLCMAQVFCGITPGGRVLNKYGGCWIAELVELGISALAKIVRG